METRAEGNYLGTWRECSNVFQIWPPLRPGEQTKRKSARICGEALLMMMMMMLHASWLMLLSWTLQLVRRTMKYETERKGRRKKKKQKNNKEYVVNAIQMCGRPSCCHLRLYFRSAAQAMKMNDEGRWYYRTREGHGVCNIHYLWRGRHDEQVVNLVSLMMLTPEAVVLSSFDLSGIEVAKRVALGLWCDRGRCGHIFIHQPGVGIDNG